MQEKMRFHIESEQPGRNEAMNEWLDEHRAIFTTLDENFPTPEEPRKTSVLLGNRKGARASSPSPVTELMEKTSTPGAAFRAVHSASSGAFARSFLVSTTTGVPPLCQAKVRYRSNLPTLNSRFKDDRINT